MTREMEFLAKGYRGNMLIATATIYPKTIVVTADKEHLSSRQFARACSRQFPRHSFFSHGDGGHYHRADADRWIGDGV